LDKDTPVASGPLHLPADTNAIPVEEQQLYLPCNGHLADVEIHLCKNQASRLLHRLWELIAEKSFQYSHIIRAAPRKSVHTRAQAIVQELVNKIALHAQIYNHCRSRLLALDCDADTSSMFQQLKKDDLNASTAILNPNAPGSTNLCLSWIWHNANVRTGVDAAADADADRFWECKYIAWPFIVIELTFL
jgi:hypothetical protein